METKNGEFTPPYLFNWRKCDVQVAHGGLWEAIHGLTLLQECQAAAGLLAGIDHQRKFSRFTEEENQSATNFNRALPSSVSFSQQ